VRIEAEAINYVTQERNRELKQRSKCASIPGLWTVSARFISSA